MLHRRKHAAQHRPRIHRLPVHAALPNRDNRRKPRKSAYDWAGARRAQQGGNSGETFLERPLGLIHQTRQTVETLKLSGSIMRHQFQLRTRQRIEAPGGPGWTPAGLPAAGVLFQQFSATPKRRKLLDEPGFCCAQISVHDIPDRLRHNGSPRRLAAYAAVRHCRNRYSII
jgi:hypothetical protein